MAGLEGPQKSSEGLSHSAPVSVSTHGGKPISKGAMVRLGSLVRGRWQATRSRGSRPAGFTGSNGQVHGQPLTRGLPQGRCTHRPRCRPFVEGRHGVSPPWSWSWGLTVEGRPLRPLQGYLEETGKGHSRHGGHGDGSFVSFISVWRRIAPGSGPEEPIISVWRRIPAKSRLR